MNTSEVLNKAADIVQEYGWKQGGWGLAYNGQPITTVCTEGAILSAAGLGEAWYESSEGDNSSFIATCPAAIAVKGYLDYYNLADWNDASERTGEEVIEVLRACAVIEAAKENADVREQVTA